MFNPANDALGIGLATRARQRRELDANSRQATNDEMAMALHDPSISAWGRYNLGRESAMAQTFPQWDAYLQAIDESANGRPVRMIGGESPAGSNQLTGMDLYSTMGTTGARPLVRDGQVGNSAVIEKRRPVSLDVLAGMKGGR